MSFTKQADLLDMRLHLHPTSSWVEAVVLPQCHLIWRCLPTLIYTASKPCMMTGLRFGSFARVWAERRNYLKHKLLGHATGFL